MARYTDEPVEFAPWGDARPYDGGFRYNCMMIQVRSRHCLRQKFETVSFLLDPPNHHLKVKLVVEHFHTKKSET